MSDDDFWERFREAQKDEVNPPEVVQTLAERAKNESVTAERLIGNGDYFINVLGFIEEGEQPHFLFPLTKGVLADSALIVEAGARRQELLDKYDGGSCVVTNRYTRIVSSKGEWNIPHNSVVSVDYVGHPSLHIQTSGRTYYIRIAGTIFDEEESLHEAAKYIRKKQREPESGESDSTDNSLEKLEKLGKLRDEGVITEEEFEEKKRDILDDI